MYSNAIAKGTRCAKSGAFVDHEATCPICGKVFTWYTGHVYTVYCKSGPDTRLCSWSCYRKAKEKQAEKRREAVERIRKKNKENAREKRELKKAQNNGENQG